MLYTNRSLAQPSCAFQAASGKVAYNARCLQIRSCARRHPRQCWGAQQHGLCQAAGCFPGKAWVCHPNLLSVVQDITEGRFLEWRRFRSTVRAFDPDVVHAHFGTVTSLFCALATSRPLVISFRGSDLNPTSNVNRLRSFVARLFSQVSVLRARHVICVSQELKNRLWVRSRPVSIIFDGVDLSAFQPEPRDEARRRLGWNPRHAFRFF